MSIAAWHRLDTALKASQRAGREILLWWRDDDAEIMTPELDRLATRAERYRIPLALAVIPAGASKDLRTILARRPDWIALVHGFAHKNYAPVGEKRAEFGAHRSLDRMQGELSMALDRLRAVLPDHARAVFVPPWNRMAPELLTRLGPIGYEAVSSFGPRHRRPSLPMLNCHLDIMNWRSRRFAGVDTVLDNLIAHIGEQGRSDGPEPIGLLTHHRQHDRAAEHFLDKLAVRLDIAPAARWLTLDEALARTPARFEATGSTHTRPRATAIA
jgi:hypothetical protein